LPTRRREKRQPAAASLTDGNGSIVVCRTEQKRGFFARITHRDGFGERGYLEMGISAFDHFELAHRFEIA